MPEIGEVARCVHYLRKHLLNKTFAKVYAQNDEIVFGKVGTSAKEIEKHLTGKKVLDVGQQGKYFYMIMSSPPHPVMHLGMSGWFPLKGHHSFYYKAKKGKQSEEWPPKSWKFRLETDDDDGEKVEGAFVDMRRLGRVRLIDCPGKDIRKNSPLKENGPDPVIDKDIVTLEWLTELCNRKRVPIKAMLLDQANISGVGNWVGDEIMYHGKIHPEQYANTLTDAQIKQLHESLHYVCGTAVELLADSEQFPEDWLFRYRWGKGKSKSTPELPNGDKIVFITVGGRTSAVVPTRQKKTGPVAGDVDEDVSEKKPASKKRKIKEEDEKAESGSDTEGITKPVKATARNKKAKSSDVVAEELKDKKLAKPAKPLVRTKAVTNSEKTKNKPTPARRSNAKQEAATPKKSEKSTSATAKTKTKVKTEEVLPESTGRRRSGRNKA